MPMPVFDKYPRLKYFLKENFLPSYLWLRSLKYLGSKVYCPCCNTNFSRFLEVGPKREPMLCPRCRSNDRDRFFWLYLEANVHFFKGVVNLLHVSPETIYYKRFKKIPGVNYIAGDKFVLQFGSTYPKDTVYLDITDMSEYQNDTFDFIFCSHVLEYIKEDKKAIRELYRVLKPGAKAIISIPINHGHYETLEDPAVTDPKEQEKLYGDTGHLRYYGEDYVERVKQAGFNTAFTSVTDFISPEMIARCVINPKDVVHLCFKN
ncbi:methyltransferase domain-containing protein [Flavitalea antarctica]